MFNVALLGLSVGPMLVYFEGQVERGVQVFLVGAIAFAYGYFRYHRFVNAREDEDGETTDDGESEGTTSADTPPPSDSAEHNG
ncbi:hypothetical protein ACFQL1_14390 [Halomicroarcula sp. GCM10025709]|uniref:DUF7322 domain-containing protein n=1 Tax=Halomicroarcula sp. GCM10025709 TaxID=3252669 RepID=UPI00361EE92D